MARGKKYVSSKVTILSKEERPFSVPENWFWTDIDSINQYSGSPVDPMKQPDTVFELYSVPSSADDYPEILAGSEIGSSKQSVIKNDILLCKINPRINRVWKVSQHTDNELMASSEWIVVRNSVINSDYLMFCFRTQFFREFMLSNVSGVGGSLMRAQPKYVKKYPVPIAPIDEQHRIVSRIESLFAKLDEAKEKAQAVVDGFELRKSAILHKAFTGELTERWRKEHGVGLESWTDTTIGEQAELITKGASPRWQGVEYTDDKSQTLFVTSENVREGYLDLTKEKYLGNEINDIQKRSVLNYGDVLVNIVGASIGRAAIYNLHQLANINQAVCMVRLKSGISNEFVCAYLNAPIAQSYYYDNKVETARANVSLGSISAMHINLPTGSEQKEVVDTLNKVLEMERQSKSAAESVLSQIDTMKKAILARAFRGELETNDPAEESAVELIKAVL